MAHHRWRLEKEQVKRYSLKEADVDGNFWWTKHLERDSVSDVTVVKDGNVLHVEVKTRSSRGRIAKPIEVEPAGVAKSQTDRAASLQLAPGTNAGQFLRFIFSKKAFEEVFLQAIADMREEYFEALAEEAILKSRWIILRGHLDLGLAVAAYLSATILKRLVGIWKLIS